MRFQAIAILFFVLLSALCACRKEKEAARPSLTASHKALVEELNTWAIPFSNNPLRLPDNQLSFLDALSDAQVVGLGEATHGSKEFFEAKHRIFQYLADKHNHRIFGFESDFAESLYIDAYITTGQGDIEQIMKTKMHFWTWRTKEVKALLEWMKQYNQDRPEAEQLHFYGFDCQAKDLQPDLLLSYFNRTSPKLHSRSGSMLIQLKNISVNSNITGSYAVFKDSLSSFQTYLDTHRDTFIRNSSPKEWKIHKQLLTTLQQTMHLIYTSQMKDNSINWRDKYMADNVQWLSELIGQEGKISVWAHNYHVSNDQKSSMGFFLNQSLGQAYQKVGFAFSTGSFTALTDNSGGSRFGIHTINEAPIETSVNWLFYHAKEKNFALDLTAIPAESGWKKLIQENHPLLSIGSLYNGTPYSHYSFSPIGKNFDWIIYFDKVRAAEQL
jgi:erythromycin esterase